MLNQSIGPILLMALILISFDSWGRCFPDKSMIIPRGSKKLTLKKSVYLHSANFYYSYRKKKGHLSLKIKKVRKKKANIYEAKFHMRCRSNRRLSRLLRKLKIPTYIGKKSKAIRESLTLGSRFPNRFSYPTLLLKEISRLKRWAQKHRFMFDYYFKKSKKGVSLYLAFLSPHGKSLVGRLWYPYVKKEKISKRYARGFKRKSYRHVTVMALKESPHKNFNRARRQVLNLCKKSKGKLAKTHCSKKKYQKISGKYSIIHSCQTQCTVPVGARIRNNKLVKASLKTKEERLDAKTFKNLQSALKKQCRGNIVQSLSWHTRTGNSYTHSHWGICSF